MTEKHLAIEKLVMRDIGFNNKYMVHMCVLKKFGMITHFVVQIDQYRLKVFF